MKTILLPTDFSPSAHWASDYAIQLALFANARLVLLHIYDPLVAMGLDGDWLGRETQKQYDQAIRQLGDLRSRLVHQVKGEMVSVVARSGLRASVIEEEVVNQQADLLVMGLVGDEPRRAREEGSLATDLIPRTQVPMLLIPPGSRFKTPRNIVLALDLAQPLNLLALDTARQFARLFGATLDMICVEDEPGPDLQQAAVHVRSLLQDDPHTFQFLSGYDLPLALDAYFADHRADLIMLLPKPHSWLRTLLLESVTQETARVASIPVLAAV